MLLTRIIFCWFPICSNQLTNCWASNSKQTNSGRVLAPQHQKAEQRETGLLTVSPADREPESRGPCGPNLAVVKLLILNMLKYTDVTGADLSSSLRTLLTHSSETERTLSTQQASWLLFDTPRHTNCHIRHIRKEI